ncbi:uncharacterized protein LOC102809195, partial [Saccoglossus kowalevskii]|uniref:Uncharacterized protein LOC102809195 n=1 Tax=Saccoglossus kowalevskii TaxID=10224 RepID=A0ABM0LUP2_SACKO
SFRSDLRCGAGYVAPNGADPAECDPNGKFPCCSPNNWCGNTDDHCKCSECVNYGKKPFRSDLRCGAGYVAPNGEDPAECDPNGKFPCCSPNNWCGNTDDHCKCSECVNYGKKPFRSDLRCGAGYVAPNGEDPAECDPNGKFPCCSPNNWCGNTDDHCKCSECVNYGKKPFRSDLRCGAGYVAPNGEDPAECDPNGKFPCCSPNNWCGNTDDHCKCSECVNYGKKPFRSDLRCGAGYVAPNGEDPAECDPNGKFPCCSPNNWCGNTDDHCKCSECVNYGKKPFRSDLRCGAGYVAPNGEDPAECDPNGKFPCCSPNNWCGNTDDHCKCSECVNYGKKPFRSDLRCGAGYVAPNGEDPAECDPNGKFPCCSPNNWCGNTDDHCKCSECVNYGKKPFRSDLRCGAGYVAPNGEDPAECDPNGKFPCCSPNNWCGNTDDHCKCSECVNYGKKPFRSDLRCGAGYVAPNGEDPAECDPNGKFPCCSPNNWCGNTDDHCKCSECVNYGKKPFRSDLRCGAGYVAPNGEDPAECDPNGKFPCCSPNNWCGNTDDHCKCSECVNYGKKPFRSDLRCGAGYVAPNGEDPAECDPNGKFPCCSPNNWCGNTDDHCKCSECVNYGK